ncbi:AMP-binding protein [Actinokineospora enzanensis]|uniref:AMP-binding protein n=1 Tax=Actinokineospora enzanensis TaxID=155975 RepID=UPI00039BCA8F|nr:AMP-binding protein [Actinokineospora enzanensis]
MTASREGLLHAPFLGVLDDGAPAIRDGDVVWTYGRLHETALHWAGRVADTVSGPPRAVAVLARHRRVAYAALLAALYTGASVVPISPSVPAATRDAMLHAARVDAMITDTAVSGHSVVRVHPDDRGRGLAEPFAVRPDSTAYILFTSGSTGVPKGVPVAHSAAAHYFDHVARRYDFGHGDVFSQTFDIGFDLALFDLFAAWGAGATVVAVPPQALRDIAGFVTRAGITVWFSTPSAIPLAARTGGLRPMPSLRWSLFCGEPLPVDDAERWQRCAPGSRLENLYGPTELTISCTAHRYTRADIESPQGIVPIGDLHDGLSGLVVDTDGHVAAEGELCVAGPQTFGGYLDPRDDAGRFLDADGRRWYRTGDVVRSRADGFVFLGRVDRQVQIRGARVEPGEIEHRLRAAPGVDAVAVVAPLGAAGRVLVAFYSGKERPAAELRNFVAARLPPASTPDHYVHVPDLPRTSRGKLDRPALLARAGSLVAA